jgi:PAS domain S-box-containing protein
MCKRNLLLSFLPTGIMLSGLGLKIASGEMMITYFFHYIIFGFLLVEVIIDHKHILMFMDNVKVHKKESLIDDNSGEKTIQARIKPRSRYISSIGKSRAFDGISKKIETHKDTIFYHRTPIKEDLQHVKKIMDELERKVIKIDILSKEIEERNANLVKQEKYLKDRLKTPKDEKVAVKSTDKKDKLIVEIKKDDERLKHYENLDDITDSAAIVQRGILKQVNPSFGKLLGFNIDKIVNRSLFDFVVPDGLSEIVEYYLDRLKNRDVSSFKTIFLTSDKKRINIKISTKPIYFNGETADIAIFHKIKNIKQDVASEKK